MRLSKLLLACLLGTVFAFPAAAQAQPREGAVRLMLEADFLRWTKVKYNGADEASSTLSLGPFGWSEGPTSALASGGVGYAVTDMVVLNAAFGVTRLSFSEDDESLLKMRVLPDADIAFGDGTVRPYVTAGLPIAFGKLGDSEGDLKQRSLGPQFGAGLFAGPVHFELTFAALFGKQTVDLGFTEAEAKFKEFTLGLSVGASLWL